jgi:hypothetical protein
MYSFDPGFNIWSKVSPKSADFSELSRNVVPTARHGHGFAAAGDGMIYLFGGVGSDGKESFLLRWF